MRAKSVQLPFFIDGVTVIDVETDRVNGLTTFGYSSGCNVVSLIRDESDDEEFLVEVASKLRSLPRPFAGFYKAFEERVLGVKMDLEIQIAPFEKKKYAIRVDVLKDPFHGDGYPCIDAWEKWLRTHDEVYRTQVLDHNLSCLLQELCLLLLKNHRQVDR